MTTSAQVLQVARPSRSEAGGETVRAALAELAAGRPVLLTGADGRHGDLLTAAQSMTTELMAFVVRHSSGFVCVALDTERADTLDIPAAAPRNQNRRGTAFGVSVDAKDGVGTGISAQDRGRTVRLLAAPGTTRHDFTRPGHLVTLRAVSGGVLSRAGHTEAGVDLMKLAGLTPVAVLADLVVSDVGNGAETGPVDRPGLTPAREGVERFLAEHAVVSVSVAQLVAFRHQYEVVVQRAATARITTPAGEFTAVGYRSRRDDREHLAFVHGDVTSCRRPVSVYVRHESVLDDPFAGSAVTTSGGGEHDAAPASVLQAVANAGTGVVIYVRAAIGSAEGLIGRLRRIEAAQQGVPALAVDETGAEVAALTRQILDDLGVRIVRLHSTDRSLHRNLIDLGVQCVAPPRRGT